MLESALAIALALWIADKASGGILGEYAKRFWFSRVHRLRSSEDVRLELARQRAAEIDAVEARVLEILRQNDALLQENIELRLELSRLKRASGDAEDNPG